MNVDKGMEPAEDMENEREREFYFYHSDHLGSSSFITDATGNANQHLQYLPFGETFVDQQNGYDSRYTFSAKEKDDETQYSYFGARYYDSDLSVWLSVDPLAGKYPSTSPYAYVENNPVMYFDPDGSKIIAVGALSRYYVKSYLKEHFGNSKIIKVKGNGELKINQKKFDKFYATATDNQKILMKGLSDAIGRKEIAQVHINESETTFELAEPIPGSDLALTRDITTEAPAITIAPTVKFPDYYIIINNEKANNDELNSVDGGKTGKSASATFFHEVLDEFLNYFTKKTVTDDSPQIDKVAFHNAALENLGKKARDGSEHQ